jgi:hypothetical protein
MKVEVLYFEGSPNHSAWIVEEICGTVLGRGSKTSPLESVRACNFPEMHESNLKIGHRRRGQEVTWKKSSTFPSRA